MVGRIFLAFLAFALVSVVFKMVILALVIAGLIFRTKATVGLLLLGGLLTLLHKQPVLGLGILAVVVIVAIAGAAKKQPEEQPTKLLE